MIRSFKCAETQKIHEGKASKVLPRDIQPVMRRKLAYLAEAKSLLDLRIPPANRLEALKGSRKGQYSIRVNQQWRLCFVWRDNAAENVETVDYH